MPSKDQGFTEDQVEDFKEVFQLFDTKGDGLIQVEIFLLQENALRALSGSYKNPLVVIKRKWTLGCSLQARSW